MAFTISGDTLRSRVARRVFSLFLLATVAPVALLAALAYTFVGNQLLQQGERQVGYLAKATAAHVYERVLALRRELDLDADAVVVGVGAPSFVRLAPGERARRFLGFARIDRNGGRRVLTGAPPPEIALDAGRREFLAAGHALIVTVPGENGAARAVMFESIHGGDDVLAAEINPGWLREVTETLPFGTDACVLDAHARPLLCSRPGLVHALAAPGGSGSRATANGETLEGSESLSAAKVIFLESNFRTPQWTVVITRSKSAALAAASGFEAVFVPVLLLAILVVVLVSIFLIRRTMVPLERLRDGTAAVAAGDFDARISVDSADEFEQLADSFNDMAGRIGRQVGALTTMATIDRIILSTSTTDEVVDAVLAHAREAVRCDIVGVTLVEEPGAGLVVTHLGDGRRAEHRIAIPGHLDACETARLEAADEHVLHAGDPRAPAFVAPLTALGARALALFPVLLDGHLAGAVVLGYHREEVGSSREERAWTRNLADHLAVAIASARREEKLYQQAHFDRLTGLPNRLLLEDRLDQAIARARRNRTAVAVLFLDVDRFKTVNDSCGHGTGDKLLAAIATELTAALRSTDTVARFGGDEFVIVVPEIEDPARVIAEVSVIAEKILGVMSRRFAIDGGEHKLTASIGIAAYPTDAESVDDLLKGADAAMYHAKERSGGSFHFFSPELDRAVRERLEVEQGLHRAIEKREFEVYFQPVVDARSHEIVAAEALVRWNHPQRGVVLPSRFLPAAIDAGLIHPIGEWVMREACGRAARWRAEGLGPVRVAVNLSATQLARPSIVEMIERVLHETGLEPQALDIEITEEALVADLGAAGDTLRAIAALGARITLDDFGTGYCSLSYLNSFPINAIKIDRTFVRDLRPDAEGASIASTIIALGHGLGLEVVAEGVETDEQLRYLVAAGCDQLQGHLFGRPEPAARVRRLLVGSAAGRRWLSHLGTPSS